MAAAQGYAEAQYNMGVMYRDGEGVSQDYAEAAKWFRKAAEQGDANAERMAAIASWFDENKWYSPSNPEMQSYADAMSDHFIRTTGKRGKELLDYVRQEVEKRFPEKFAHQIHLFDNEWLRRR
jgi:hypothetical protein